VSKRFWGILSPLLTKEGRGRWYLCGSRFATCSYKFVIALCEIFGSGYKPEPAGRNRTPFALSFRLRRTKGRTFIGVKTFLGNSFSPPLYKGRPGGVSIASSPLSPFFLLSPFDSLCHFERVSRSPRENGGRNLYHRDRTSP